MNARVNLQPPKPTAQVQPYVDALGLDRALAFILRYGGTPVYIRTSQTNTAHYVNLTGEAGARALGEIVDRLPKRVPSQKAWAADVLRWQGLSTSDIAREIRVSDVSVRNMLRTRDGRAEEMKARAEIGAK